MATLYWGGGSGNWDGSSATHWYTDLARTTPSASAPTNADDVIFDSVSNATAYAVTMVTGAVCRDCTVSGPASGSVTFSGSGNFSIFGSWSVAATGVIWSTTGTNTMAATTTGKTINTNGVSINSGTIDFNGVGGGWTCTSAFNSGAGNITLTNGSLNTGNQTFTCNFLSTTNSNVRSLTLGSSTCTFGGGGSFQTTNTTNLTFSAGTSTVNITNANATFSGGGLTFYNVAFTAVAPGTLTINGANTYNNLTFTSRNATGVGSIVFSANQTINGTLTLGAANTPIRRLFVQSNAIGTQRTITVNGSLAALADIDFRDIKAAGSVATPWTGTRLGNCLGNDATTITFPAGVNKYWYSATGAGGLWTDAQWELTAGGTSPSINNFPLAQDTVVFQNANLTAGNTITVNTAAWNIGSLNFSSRSTAMNFNQGINAIYCYGSITLSSSVSLTGVITAGIQMCGQGITQNVTSAGVTSNYYLNVTAPTGTVKLLDNFVTSSSTASRLTQGTLDLNNFSYTALTFLNNSGSTRTLAFGSTGSIILTGNAATIWVGSDLTGFTYTGTSLIQATYAGSTGTRTISHGQSANGTETTALNFSITAGSDTVTFTATPRVKNLTFTGFSGTWTNTGALVYGNLTISSGMTLGASASTVYFASASATQNLTTAGKTLDFPVTIGYLGAEACNVVLQDACTLGSTRSFALSAGTLTLNGNNLSAGFWYSNYTTAKAITFGTNKIVITGNAGNTFNASGTNFTYTGTPTIEFNYAGSTGTRTISTTFTETNSLNLNIVNGSDTIVFASPTVFKSLDFTGFSGSFTNQGTTLYGSLNISNGMTVSASANPVTFASTASGNTITSNGKIIDMPVVFNGIGGIWTCQDALTLGSTRALTMTNGTLKLKSGATSTVGSFVTTGTNQKYLGSSIPGTQATITDASGVNSVSYLTISDSLATGGATWEAFYGNGNLDAGNNTNWEFGETPVLGTEYTYRIRSFTQPRRF